MPSPHRLVIPDRPHHITQRGTKRQDVFFTDAHRLSYLALLKHYATKYGTRFWGYSLMNNHVHHVSVPSVEESLALTFGLTHERYALSINAQYDWSGHLWQARFYSCVLDELHHWRALRYVELNAVRAGLVSAPQDYPWSSAAAHLGGEDPSGLLDLDTWRELWPGTSWADYLGAPDAEADVIPLRLHTIRGKPYGNRDFITRLEEQVGHPLRYRSIGRPPEG
jgi:putative transposase